MAADPIRELHRLIDQLSDEEATALLADVRQRTRRHRGRTAIPTMHIAPPLRSIDDLAGDVFPPDESADEFDATIRRWRDEGHA